jgi:hypothetical protein
MAKINRAQAADKARDFLSSFKHVAPDGKEQQLLVYGVEPGDDGLHVTYMVFFMEMQGGRPSEGVQVIARAGEAAFKTTHPDLARVPFHHHFRPV